jgi:hypothetical protein
MSRCRALEKVKIIYVLSRSAVKRKAIERWLKLKRRAEVRVVYIDAQPTGCPQPLGLLSATQCLTFRLPLLFAEEVGAMYVGIENFIVLDAQGWHDMVTVSATCITRSGELLTVNTVGQFANIIPRRFAPAAEPDIPLPTGYTQTVGTRIHEAYPHVPHDDWPTSVSAANVDRATQIVDALRSLDEKLKHLVCM